MSLARPPGFRGPFRDDPLARALYSEAAGIARCLPDAVAVPADDEDVSALVDWAHRTALPLVPRGSASSMAGGAVGAGTALDLSRLDRIGRVDVAERRLWVGPGALRGAVNEKARAHGLRFPVDPSSGAFCTIGGMAATNAAGAHTLRFGPMRSWVTAVDCIFDDGSRAIIRRGDAPPTHVPALTRFRDEVAPVLQVHVDAESVAHPGVRKESSGYALAAYARTRDLVDLLVGSEGTLALFVGVELALAPAAGATSSVLAAFDSLDAAVDGAALARESAASACELLDRTFLEIAEPRGGAGAEAVLLIEIEAADRDAAAAAAKSLGGALERAGASSVRLGLDAAAEATLWALRHAASPILARLDETLKSMQFVEDACVPPDRVAEYVRGVRAALASRGVRGVIFGHAGDGHVHVNPLVDVRRPDWRECVVAILSEVTDLVARLGGTIAGEHGDGRLRTPLLERVWPPPAPSLFAMVKRAFDPRGILNPGVKVALPGQVALGDIKYDPALPPLPAAARRALDRIERERAWNRFRLGMA